MHRSGAVMAWNVFKFCTALRGLGSVMILLVLGIVGVTYYAVVVSNYGPLLLHGGLDSLASLALLLPFHGLLVMLLWSYFSVVLTDPGGVPSNWRPEVDEEQGEADPLTGPEPSPNPASIGVLDGHLVGAGASDGDPVQHLVPQLLALNPEEMDPASFTLDLALTHPVLGEVAIVEDGALALALDRATTEEARAMHFPEVIVMVETRLAVAVDVKLGREDHLDRVEERMGKLLISSFLNILLGSI